MSNAEIFPRLELIKTHRIRFHEHAERRRTLRLVERIRREGLLRNPPVVAGLGKGDVLLLDGANRVSAFRELNYSHIPVQVVDYGDHAIELNVWHHLLVDARTLNLRDTLSALPGISLRPVERRELGRLLEFREVYAVWVDEKTGCWGLYPDPEAATLDVRKRIAALNEIIGCYEGKSPLERIKLADYDSLPAVLSSADHQLCLYPVLTKEELLLLAREGIMIPTGITRHLIPGRALGLNLELTFLTAKLDDLEKRDHFRACVERIETGGKIRYYEESVFIMNE